MERFGNTIRLSPYEAGTAIKALRYLGQLGWKGDDFRDSPHTQLSVSLEGCLNEPNRRGPVELRRKLGRKVRDALDFVDQNPEAILNEMVGVEAFKNTEEFRDLQSQTGDGSMPPQPPLTRADLEPVVQVFVEECQNLRAQF